MGKASPCKGSPIDGRHSWEGTGLDTDDILGLVETRKCVRCGQREIGRYDGPRRKVRRWFTVAAGVLAVTVTACAPPKAVNGVPYLSERAVACKVTADATDPAQCGTWIAQRTRVYMHPGPRWWWYNDAVYNAATPFVVWKP